MTNELYDQRLIKLDVLAKDEAGKNPCVVEEGKGALESIGLSKTRSIFYYIKLMSRVIGTSSFRPATRYRSVAYYYVGKQLTTNKEFRDKFYKTVVNHDETIFNIDGRRFNSNIKFNTRARKSNVAKKIEELETSSHDKNESSL
jgi:hypothetical protein